MRSRTALLRPSLDLLPAYVAALQRGWSADNLRGRVAAEEELARIEADAAGFVARLEDAEAAGPPIALPDGRTVARLPSLRRWIWAADEDGPEGFCGSIGFRWRAGGGPLPDWVSGHIGYAVVPWRRGEGHASRALRLILPFARANGLAHVEITTDPENLASQRVITANGGRLVERFRDVVWHGGAEVLRFRIEL